jgi:molybdopterin synthase catalytic subunit
MIEITKEALSPDRIINETKTDSSGCVVTYVGIIRNHSPKKNLQTYGLQGLTLIADEAIQKWALEKVSIVYRIGKLKSGDSNTVIAIAAGHRQEGFAACQYIIDSLQNWSPIVENENNPE